MELAESYRGKSFVVVDEDARVRRDEDISEFAMSGGKPVVIAKGTRVSIFEIRIEPNGSQDQIVFGRAASEDGATIFGWTSTRNLQGKFTNETLGVVKPAHGAGQFGPNAAWFKGKYLGQVDLVAIVDATQDIERVGMNTLKPYIEMAQAAAAAGVRVALNSGFRSYGEQKHLYEGYKKRLRGFNLAAAPGASRHQNGIAFDIDVASSGSGNPAYDWLKANATRFDFVRTVSKEPWHWEHDPAQAAKAKAAGTFKAPTVDP